MMTSYRYVQNCVHGRTCLPYEGSSLLINYYAPKNVRNYNNNNNNIISVVTFWLFYRF